MAASDPVPPPDPYQRPVRPMQAADGAIPVGSAWAFEFDWDGLRAIAYLHPERLRLLSGSGERPISRTYPELAALAALAERRGEMVLDGTIITPRGPRALRRRMGHSAPGPALVGRHPVSFCITDVLHLDGGSTTDLPYLRRRELLAELDLDGLPALLSPFFVDVDGEDVLRIAAEHGIGAVLAKRLQSRYQPGRRTRAWIRTPVARPPDGRPGRAAGSPGVPAGRSGVPAPADPAPGDAVAAAPQPVADSVVTDPAALDEAVRLAQAEVRALRAQISPHFVYNALTTISAYVRTDPSRARDLLGEFAEYARYSFRAGAKATTLGAELANIEHYLALEQARFDDRLRVSRQVEDGLLDTVLPFLTVQPLVEHAVRHGIEGTPSGGTLRIAAETDGADCVITVAQDAGAEAARLAELADDLRARLTGAGHPDSVRVTVDDQGSSVTLRVAR